MRQPPRPLTKAAGHLLALLVFAALISGCKLIFEPPEDAVNRFLEAAVARDYRTIEELADDELIRDQMREVAAAFNSSVYRGKAGYWDVIEIDEDDVTGLTYVYVEVEIPQRERTTVYGNDKRTVELMFEMERNNLRWTIYQVDGLDQLVQEVNRAR